MRTASEEPNPHLLPLDGYPGRYYAAGFIGPVTTAARDMSISQLRPLLPCCERITWGINGPWNTIRHQNRTLVHRRAVIAAKLAAAVERAARVAKEAQTWRDVSRL